VKIRAAFKEGDVLNSLWVFNASQPSEVKTLVIGSISIIQR